MRLEPATLVLRANVTPMLRAGEQEASVLLFDSTGLSHELLLPASVALQLSIDLLRMIQQGVEFAAPDVEEPPLLVPTDEDEVTELEPPGPLRTGVAFAEPGEGLR